MGTAVATWQTHTPGATGWHGLVTAGQLQTFVLRFNSSLGTADMGNVATRAPSIRVVPVDDL